MRRNILVVTALFVGFLAYSCPSANAEGLLRKIFKKKSEPAACEPAPPACCEPAPEPTCEPAPPPACCEPAPLPDPCCEAAPPTPCCEPVPPAPCCEPAPPPPCSANARIPSHGVSYAMSISEGPIYVIQTFPSPPKNPTLAVAYPIIAMKPTSLTP